MTSASTVGAGKAPLTVIPVPGTGAEDVVVDARGDVWTGTEDGSVFRVRPDGGRIERVAHTGGRPLGLELYGDRILVADAHRGLLAVDDQGRVERLVDSVDGRKMVFCNNAAVASNGDIWFSDSSTVHPIERWKNDFVENTCTGRLLRRRADGTVETHLDGLAFANGVALAADESWVAVAETGRRTVVRLWLAGDRAGQRELLVDDLPGYPDNIALGSDGLVWVTIASPRDPLVERLQRGPRPLRRAVTRIPAALQPKPKQTAWVQAYDAAGRLVHDLDAESSSYHMVTGVREHDGRVWMGSLVEPAIAVADVPAP
jgi:sugar lactone lactonase YvrE